MRPLTEGDHDTVVLLYESGKTLRQVSDNLGIRYQEVASYIRGRGLTRCLSQRASKSPWRRPRRKKS